MPTPENEAREGLGRIVIGGDVCPINANEPVCARGDADTAFGGLVELMRSADFCVVNLECPLIHRPGPISKIGPVIAAKRETSRVLPAAGIHAVTMANNHIMDHGVAGLNSTIIACEEQGIAHFGAGPDLQSARRILICEVGGKRVGFLGVTHHEFSTAGETSAGAAPMDPVEVHAQIRNQEDAWDLLVALVHTGPSQYPLPTPKLQKYCRFLVDIGASAVVCQHSHCTGTYEDYEGALIVYGQGNLLFDWLPEPGPDWFRGFLIDLEIGSGGVLSYRFVPYERGPDGVGVGRLLGQEADRFMNGIKKASRSVLDPREIRRKWDEYCVRRSNSYYQQLLLGYLPGAGLLRRAADRLGMKVVPLRERHRMTLLNLVRCETHREVLETLLARADSPD